VAPPLVSVLLPVRDAEATLPACLRSVARQRETDLECVVVDDGSRDGSRAAAEAFAGSDPRFRVVATPRRGLVAALGAGLAACRGRFVARMDADDWMHRDRLRAQVAHLEAHPGLAAAGCHVRLFPRCSVGPGMRAYEAWLASVNGPRRVREEAFVECPVAHPTLVARAWVLRAMGYRDAGWPEDYDLLLRLLAAGHEVGVVPRRLLAWRQGPERLSRRSPVYAQERFTACKAAFLAEGLLRRRDDYVLWGYGATGKALARALARHGKHPARIVELHPGRVGETIRGARVVRPEAVGGPGGPPVVVSVAGAAARAWIRAELARRGHRETVDFVCAA